MKKDNLCVLVLGASGMLGNAVYRVFGSDSQFRTIGTVRRSIRPRLIPEVAYGEMREGIDVEDVDSLIKIFQTTRPDVVINCVGLVKQLEDANDVLASIPLNTLLPHRLALLCEVSNSRLIHVSTDCVYSGRKGMYRENDIPDAYDLYGRSKYLGEVVGSNSITLRTSIIGHELSGSRSLINWFLAQHSRVRGYRKAIFSGLPTVELARVMRDYVIPRPDLSGLYHVSADPINKYELLKIVADTYNKKIVIEPDDDFVIDRSLDSSRFRTETGFSPKSWPELVRSMQMFR